MNKFINLKSIFLTLVLTISISIITSQNVFAATLSTKSYTVKKGDCLYKIARNNGETLYNLRKANNKWNNAITPGQVINVSAVTSPNIKQPAKAIAASPNVDKVKNVAIQYTASDLDLLARLITAEAQGEPYDAQVAVGAVVVNRVKSNLFPNSISAVINQTVKGCYQFTPVLNGNINRPALPNAIKAAYAALSGNDPTNKSLFFYDYLATDAWIRAQPVSIKINKLIFAY